MAQFFAGTSGWAYPSWKPAFYPEKLPQKNFLKHYATQLNTVEVNFSFRQLLKETTVQKWIAESPDGFRFGIKAHQVITHIKRLKDSEEFVKRFLGTIEALAQVQKLGPVLFQLPPNMKANPEVLQNFLYSLPRNLCAAFEFRHDSWFTDETFTALRDRGIALCVAENEDRTTPDVVTAPYCYYRFRKPSYTPEERAAMVARMREHLAAGRDVFAYFKHEETPEGALYAVEMLRAI
jgi:uncharacterized protein YecE (DUF72 family)